MERVVNTQDEFVINEPRYRSVSTQVSAKILSPAEISLDEMGAIVATFLAEITVPDVGFRPVEAHQNPRDISVIAFKKTKLRNDIGIALEHFNEMKDDTEPNSRERAHHLVKQMFRSMNVPRMPTLVHHCLYP